MATEDSAGHTLSEKLRSNLQRIEELTQRMVSALSAKSPHDPALDAPGPEVFTNASQAFMKDFINNPAKLIESQAAWWGQSLQAFVETQGRFSAGNPPQPDPQLPADRRFSNPLWNSHPWFAYLRRQYFVNAETLRRSVENLQGLSPAEQQRVGYFTSQIIDMMAPTNFFGTNPDALERAMATEGESLVRGLENLVRDIEANRGELLVTLSDPAAFTVGQNIGATPGDVVFRNRILELIQIRPTTAKVHRTPLIIFPPWINKFYILDLKPQNSLLRWIADQGFTLFIVSWKNPDASYAGFGLDEYYREGYRAAIKAVQDITGEPKVNAVGYCIAGTTLSMSLARMAQDGEVPVRSATFFTTLTDFADQGEFTPFLDNDFIDGIEREVGARGYLPAAIMSRTFSFLRSNDLIWQPAIRSYMMGDPPPAFDLLHWNGDGTNLPAKMAVDYLRGLCQDNRFMSGDYVLDGQKVSPDQVKVPFCAIACETDHIAAWRSSYAGLKRFGSKDKTFILAQSGHIAGIVNPPGKDKYGHYFNSEGMQAATAQDWQSDATFAAGSWWPRWAAWLARQSGARVPARIPGAAADYPVLAASPGDYVRESAVPALV